MSNSQVEQRLVLAQFRLMAAKEAVVRFPTDPVAAEELQRATAELEAVMALRARQPS